MWQSLMALSQPAFLWMPVSVDWGVVVSPYSLHTGERALRSPSNRPWKESSVNTLIHIKKQKIIRKLKLQKVSKKYIETKEVHCHHWQQLLRTEEVFISPTIQNRKSTNMADNGNNGPAPSSPALEIVTKEALSSCLLECFASPTFANFVVAAINLYLDKINLQMNKNSKAVSNHTQEIANMKQKLEDQNLKIKSLEKKVTSKEKADKLSILKITGLKNSETEAIHTLLQLAKEKLEVPLQRDDFTIRLIRPGTKKYHRSTLCSCTASGNESKYTKLARN